MTEETDRVHVAEDLVIDAPRRSLGNGTWITGTLSGHRFQALVLPADAPSVDYELNGDSRIIKLWVQRIADERIVFNWDRGADVPAEDATAQAIVAFMCDGLAEYVYGT